MNTNEISSSKDTLDSRDIQERIDELVSLDKEDLEEERAEEELTNLKTLKEDVGNDEEWDFGITFISECFFEDYARELAEDIGAINKDTTWPANCIDWDQAAQELRIDYEAINFDDVTYYYRC